MKNLGIASLLKQAQQVQEEMAKVKQELAGMKVTGSSGGGMVVVTANGKQQILGQPLNTTPQDNPRETQE